jgi:hypothetical protein
MQKVFETVSRTPFALRNQVSDEERSVSTFSLLSFVFITEETAIPGKFNL